MKPLATLDDLLARWDGTTELDPTRAEAALDDASVFLVAYLGSRYTVPTDVQADVLKTIACSVAMRVLSVAESSAGYGVTQFSQTASSFTEQRSFSNPTGDMYLTTAEKKLLATVFGKDNMFTVPCWIGGRP